MNWQNNIEYMTELVMFPSPTGVNYYEFDLIEKEWVSKSFRPQQGLTIMNPSLQNPDKH